MKNKEIIDLKNLTPEQQQNFDDLFAEIEYFTQTQWMALDDPDQMTQEIFDSIQLRRLEIGPVLESISMKIFLKYPDYAMNYTNRLEKAMDEPSPDIAFLDNPYERIRQGILKEFRYDIGSLD